MCLAELLRKPPPRPTFGLYSGWRRLKLSIIVAPPPQCKPLANAGPPDPAVPHKKRKNPPIRSASGALWIRPTTASNRASRLPCQRRSWEHRQMKALQNPIQLTIAGTLRRISPTSAPAGQARSLESHGPATPSPKHWFPRPASLMSISVFESLGAISNSPPGCYLGGNRQKVTPRTPFPEVYISRGVRLPIPILLLRPFLAAGNPQPCSEASPKCHARCPLSPPAVATWAWKHQNQGHAWGRRQLESAAGAWSLRIVFLQHNGFAQGARIR